MPKRLRSPSNTRAPSAAFNRASAEGTQRYADRRRKEFLADFYRAPTRDTGLQLSSIAIGTYLGNPDDATDAEYRAAIGAALSSGVNVIDTAINYRCQRSERVIGDVLQEMISEQRIRRDEVVLCTKAGYLPLDGTPPASREAYEAYVRSEYIERGLLAQDDLVGGGHALAPAFILDQLDRSLRNLGVQAVDFFYLHNPEQQLTSIAPDELRVRLRAAFEALEHCVSIGKIGKYGCATWSGLRLPAGSQGHLSLYDLAAIATEAGGRDHKFRVVQLPINLHMSEAVRVSTQRDPRGRLVHVTDAATELGIDLVASAPLMQGQLTRDLPPQVREIFGSGTDAQRALSFARTVPAVLTAAVGMKQVSHVSENLDSVRSTTA